MSTNALPLEAPIPEGRIFLNSHCYLQETDGCVVAFVKGMPIHTYDIDDIVAARLVMAQLAEMKVATQEQIAQAFGVKRITVCRLRVEYRKHGIAGLMPKKRGPKGPRKTGGRKDKVIIKLKKAGESNCLIAQKLGTSECAIRKALERLGYKAPQPIQHELPVIERDQSEAEGDATQVEGAGESEKADDLETKDAANEQAVSTASADEVQSEEHTIIECDQSEEEDAVQVEGAGKAEEADDRETKDAANKQSASTAIADEVQSEERTIPENAIGVSIPVVCPSLDSDPANREMDRLSARLGLLYDAAPLFQSVQGVAGLGVLLAIPVLVAHGVFNDVMAVFHNIGPAFYGLRNAVLTLLVCFLRGINRPENLKEHSPEALGQVMGLDRAPEMKTLRRKIHDLVFQSKVFEFAKRQMKRHLMRLKKDLLWLYVDGHVSVYSGKRKMSKQHVTRLRISLPATLDYWVNDEKGDPLMVLTGRPRKGMVSVIEDVIKEIRDLGEKRTITLVFDREGWSPALFARFDGMENVRFVTYRKAKKGKKLPRLPASAFETYKAKFDGHDVEYTLVDGQVSIEYGAGKKKKRLKLRQVTRLSENGKQTHVLTNDTETSEVELAYRMFSRWRQENYLKYMRQKKDLDALVTYVMEEADAERLVQNPKRVKLNKELKRKRAELAELMAEYGGRAMDNEEVSRPTMRGFKIANGKLGKEIQRRKENIEELDARRRKLPAKVPVSSTMPGQSPKKAHVETRRFIHAFRMVAYRAESALRELLRSEYSRWHHESRTLVRTFLNASGDIELADGELRIKLEKQSSPHRTRLLAHLCEQLNSQRTTFPGSDLVLRFEAREAADVSGSS